MIAIVGLSHRTAAVNVRERYAIPEDAQESIAKTLLDGGSVDGVMVLSTCNRTELLVSTKGEAPPGEVLRAALTREAHGVERDDVHVFYHYEGDDAVRHLFRVAASLDSLVVGEPQILGQLKDANDRADGWGTLRGSLQGTMRHAFQCAKRVRTETGIGAGLVSISSVAIELAERIFGDLKNVRVLLLGAGDMGEAAAKSLAGTSHSLGVCNRSFEKAADLAGRYGAQAIPWERLEPAITDADVVVVSTGARQPVVSTEAVRRILKTRRGRPIFFVDVALPRNVEASVHGLDGAYVYDIDDLESIVREGVEARRESVDRAEAVVNDELGAYLRARRERTVDPLIVSLRERTRSVLRAELERSLKGKLRHLTDMDREALETMLDAATNKLVHPTIVRLKRAAATPGDEHLVDAASELFGDEAHAPDAAAGLRVIRGG